MTCVSFHAATTSITVTLAWTLLNSGIALIGYWFAAALVDNIHWGRVRLQVRLCHPMSRAVLTPRMLVHKP